MGPSGLSKAGLYEGPELVGRERGGVCDDLGAVADVVEQIALGPDGSAKVAALVERVRSACLAEASDDAVVRCVEEENADRDAVAAELIDDDTGVGDEGLVTHVDAGGDTVQFAAGGAGEVNDLWEQHNREVVHAEIAKVLE